MLKDRTGRRASAGKAPPFLFLPSFMERRVKRAKGKGFRVVTGLELD
jgi:hypothetical protein